MVGWDNCSESQPTPCGWSHTSLDFVLFQQLHDFQGTLSTHYSNNHKHTWVLRFYTFSATTQTTTNESALWLVEIIDQITTQTTGLLGWHHLPYFVREPKHWVDIITQPTLWHDSVRFSRYNSQINISTRFTTCFMISWENIKYARLYSPFCAFWQEVLHNLFEHLELK